MCSTDSVFCYSYAANNSPGQCLGIF